jgi:hypothetical protein
MLKEMERFYGGFWGKTKNYRNRFELILNFFGMDFLLVA